MTHHKPKFNIYKIVNSCPECEKELEEIITKIRRGLDFSIWFFEDAKTKGRYHLISMGEKER